MLDVDQQLERLLRGSDSTYSREELARKLTRALKTTTPLRVKLGMDPTAPDLTLGHTVVLQKLRDFQDCGHKAVLIIGDYTAMIGDPSGKSKTRPILTPEQVKINADTYLAQAGKVIDTDKTKLEIRHNSEWLSPLSFADVIRMAGQVTVARMMERDTFAKRMKAGAEVFCHELFYPMMQARDSVEIRADVELGGTDQTFNNLMGRDFQRSAGQEAQVVMVMPLLVGTDGKEKMSKSLGNYIGVTDPPSEMFAKVMSVPDALMRNYCTLLTRLEDARIDELCDAKRTHPRDAKVELGKRIVTRFHDATSAGKAADEFFRIHGAGKTGLPDDIPDKHLGPDVRFHTPGQDDEESQTIHTSTRRIGVGGTRTHLFHLPRVLRECGFASTNADARRLIEQGGIQLNGTVVSEAFKGVPLKTGDILQRGKRKFVRLVVE